MKFFDRLLFSLMVPVCIIGIILTLRVSVVDSDGIHPLQLGAVLWSWLFLWMATLGAMSLAKKTVITYNISTIHKKQFWQTYSWEGWKNDLASLWGIGSVLFFGFTGVSFVWPNSGQIMITQDIISSNPVISLYIVHAIVVFYCVLFLWSSFIAPFNLALKINNKTVKPGMKYKLWPLGEYEIKALPETIIVRINRFRLNIGEHTYDPLVMAKVEIQLDKVDSDTPFNFTAINEAVSQHIRTVITERFSIKQCISELFNDRIDKDRECEVLGVPIILPALIDVTLDAWL